MTTQNTLRRHLLIGAALSVITLSPALAQEVQQAAASVNDALDEIVVTATKRETNLQETPIAISVVNTENLQDRHIQALLDLGDGAIPGLRVATFEARQSALTIGIRGIVPLDANQPAREQGVGVYIDGVYLGRQHGLNAAMLDIERIEVLKGPQGTLFGRNTEGGALSLVTRAPSGNFNVRGTAGVGNYGAHNGELHIDLPSFGGLSMKVDGVVQYQRPTTKNPLPGATGWNYFDRRGGKFAARYQPNDDFTADYSFDVGNERNSPFYSQLLNYNPNGLVVGPASGTLPSGQIRPLPPIVKVEGTERQSVAEIGVPQQPSVDKTRGHSLHLNWSVNDDLELRSISAYRRVAVDQWDNSGGAHRVPQFVSNGAFSRYSLATLKQWQISQEFQAVGTMGDSFDYVAGAFYFKERVQDDAATPSTNQWNADGTAYTILDPNLTIPGRRVLDRASVAWAESYAVYGQGTYTFADVFHLTAGARYTHDDKNGLLFIINNAPTNLTFDTSNDRVDPMATLAWDAAEDINLYAKFSTGYRSGGASSRSLTYRPFGPEKVNSYEIGAKTELLDRRLRLNAAAYMMDRTGSQIDFSVVAGVIPGSTRNTVETVNAPGTTKIRGLELEGILRLTDDLTVTGAYAYTYTKIPPTVNPFNNLLQPVFIVFTPKNAASAGIDYAKPFDNVTFKAHIDANYADATQTFDQTPVTNDKSFLVNARLALADIDVGRGAFASVSLWSRNLFNETHVYRRDPANRATLGDYGNLNAPRTFGAEISVNF
jgi:iron complex outermembrane recepter protein